MKDFFSCPGQNFFSLTNFIAQLSLTLVQTKVTAAWSLQANGKTKKCWVSENEALTLWITVFT